ncbi:MAG: multifunctional CCA tRNA nucleotidyl transferase/2'3'-cyclic phosphodiesterase/2'nucleotidase/phosphatase [Casimicrobiaceae bacterium]
MKIYQVGGSVRDALLGLPVSDRDFVVVGATPEAMIALGYKPVGRDFPVFLHPESHDEYALARTERKHGRGHQGFVFHAQPDVTLEDDLARRDLTINAMARDEAGNLIDPYGGQRDLAARTLRHVSPAFGEDPLRVLRVARFAARFAFEVDDATMALMTALVQRGELRDLSGERVWREFSRGLTEAHPSRMLSVLRCCGVLREIAPELEFLFECNSPSGQAPLGVSTARALDCGARRNPTLIVQYAICSRHLDIDAATTLAARLRASIDCRDAAFNAIRYAGTLERAQPLSAAEWLSLLSGLDALRRPERMQWLLRVVRAYAAADSVLAEDDCAGIAAEANNALGALNAVDYGNLDNGAGVDVEAQVRARRLSALENWLAAEIRSGTT